MEDNYRLLKRKLEFYNREYNSSVKKLKVLESLLGEEDRLALSLKVEKESRPSSPCHDSDEECEFLFPEVLYRDVTQDEIENCHPYLHDKIPDEDVPSVVQEVEIIVDPEGCIQQHSRSECRLHPFIIQPSWKEKEGPFSDNVKFCSLCMCFICEVLPSQCNQWSATENAHCNAHRRSDHWKGLRTALKSDLVKKLPAAWKTDEFCAAISSMQNDLLSLHQNFKDFRGGEETDSCDDDYYDDFYGRDCCCDCHYSYWDRYEGCMDCDDYHNRNRVVHNRTCHEVKKICGDLKVMLDEAADISVLILKYVTFATCFFQEDFSVKDSDREDYFLEDIKSAISSICCMALEMMIAPHKKVKSEVKKWAECELGSAVKCFKKKFPSICPEIENKLKCIKLAWALGSGLKQLLKKPHSSNKPIHHPICVAAPIVNIFKEKKQYNLALRYIGLLEYSVSRVEICVDMPSTSSCTTCNKEMYINRKDARDLIPFLLIKAGKPVQAALFTVLPYDHQLKSGNLVLVATQDEFVKEFDTLTFQAVSSKPVKNWPADKCKFFISELMAAAGYQEESYANGQTKKFVTKFNVMDLRCAIWFIMQAFLQNTVFINGYYSDQSLHNWLCPETDRGLSLLDDKRLDHKVSSIIDKAEKNLLKIEDILNISDDDLKIFMPRLLVYLLCRKVDVSNTYLDFSRPMYNFTNQKLYGLSLLYYKQLEQSMHNSLQSERFTLRYKTPLLNEIVANVLPQLSSLPFNKEEFEGWLRDRVLSLGNSVQLLCVINKKLDKNTSESAEMQKWLLQWAVTLMKQLANGTRSLWDHHNRGYSAAELTKLIKDEFLSVAEKLKYRGLNEAILEMDFLNTVSWKAYHKLSDYYGPDEWPEKQKLLMNEVLQNIKGRNQLTTKMVSSLELLLKVCELRCVQYIFKVATNSGRSEEEHRMRNWLLYKSTELIKTVAFQDHLDNYVESLQPFCAAILAYYGLLNKMKPAYTFGYMYNRRLYSISETLPTPSDVETKFCIMDCMKRFVGQVSPSGCGAVLREAVDTVTQAYDTGTISHELRTSLRDWLLQMKELYRVCYCQSQFVTDLNKLRKVLRRKKVILNALDESAVLYQARLGNIAPDKDTPPLMIERPLSTDNGKVKHMNKLGKEIVLNQNKETVLQKVPVTISKPSAPSSAPTPIPAQTHIGVTAVSQCPASSRPTVTSQYSCFQTTASTQSTGSRSAVHETSPSSRKSISTIASGASASS